MRDPATFRQQPIEPRKSVRELAIELAILPIRSGNEGKPQRFVDILEPRVEADIQEFIGDAVPDTVRDMFIERYGRADIVDTLQRLKKSLENIQNNHPAYDAEILEEAPDIIEALKKESYRFKEKYKAAIGDRAIHEELTGLADNADKAAANMKMNMPHIDPHDINQIDNARSRNTADFYQACWNFDDLQIAFKKALELQEAVIREQRGR